MTPKLFPLALCALLAVPAALVQGCGKGPFKAADPNETDNPRHAPYQVDTMVAPAAPATLNANGTPNSSSKAVPPAGRAGQGR